MVASHSIKTVFVREITHRWVIRWCLYLSGDLFANCHTLYVLFLWYVRLVLIILLVNALVLR